MRWQFYDTREYIHYVSFLLVKMIIVCNNQDASRDNMHFIEEITRKRKKKDAMMVVGWSC